MYILRVFASKREGFFDAETEFLVWVRENVAPLNAIRDITDEESIDYKVIREAGAIANSANSKMSDTDLRTMQTKMVNKLRTQSNPSTAYTIAFKIKWSGVPWIDSLTLLVKNLHKAIPSYPFNKTGMDILKALDTANRPTMEQCKNIFKCSNVESIPANI